MIEANLSRICGLENKLIFNVKLDPKLYKSLTTKQAKSDLLMEAIDKAIEDYIVDINTLRKNNNMPETTKEEFIMRM